MKAGQIKEENLLFEDHTVQIIARLRQAVLAVIDTMPDLCSGRPVDLAAGLNIDTKLAWKIAKLIDGSDPFTAAQYIPGSSGVQIFLRAATRREVSKKLLANVRSAFSSFNDLVTMHAGNRRAFDMMLAGHSSENRLRAYLDHRRNMFEGASYVWGVQARSALRLDIIAPSADPLMSDQVTIRGFIDLRRLRPNVPWRISRGFSSNIAGVPNTEFSREPLETRTDADGNLVELPLLTEYCSQPLPECRRVDGPLGVVEYELVEGAVGNTGVLTCVMGELLRRVEPRYRAEGFIDLSQRFRVRTPSEAACIDVMYHRGLFGADINPRFTAFSDLFAEQMGALYRACDILPCQEQLHYLGRGTDVLENADFPPLPRLAEHAIRRAGWNAEDFDVYRLRMEYPPIPISLIITHDLADPPDVSRE